MDQDFTDEEKQQFRDEGLVEVEPGIWGLVGEPAEVYDVETVSNAGYWIVTSGA